MRKLVVHYHIFKNAGSSIDHALKRALHERWVAFDGTGGHMPLPAETLGSFLSTCPSILAVSSHLVRPPAPMGFDVYPIVIVRDPLDRSYSCYSFERRAPSNSKSGEVAKAHDYPGYVRWCLDHPELGGMVIMNYQTIHLSAASLRGPIYSARAEEEDFNEAVALLNSLPLPCAMEFISDFWLRLGSSLSAWSGEFVDIGPEVRANTSPERAPKGLSETRALLEASLGSELAARLADANRFDQALYERAKSISGPADGKLSANRQRTTHGT
jgi:hypothetical protein